MSKLENLATFVEVARAGSFSAAARKLQLPRSTISFRIASLEASLQVRLLKRSTRSVVLTEDGRVLYERTGNLIDTLNMSLETASELDGRFKGVIRVSVPSDLPQTPLIEAITSFRKSNSAVRFQVKFTNEMLDLVRDNIDVAIRLGDVEGPDVVRRKLLEFPCGLFAHNNWIERHGEPEHFSDISDFFYPSQRLPDLILGEERIPAVPAAAVDVNSFSMIRSMILKGAGVGVLPLQMVEHEKTERLVQVLIDYQLRPLQMHLSFATRADMTPRVRAFADHLLKFI